MKQRAKAASAGPNTRQGSRPGTVLRGALATRAALVDRSGAPTRRRLAAVVTATALLAALAFAATVFAHVSHPAQPSFGPDGSAATSFELASGVAVDQQTHDIYVADIPTGSIRKFDENHQPSNFSALGTNEITGLSFFGGSGESQIAVDSSTHRIYATAGDAIHAFKANGEPFEFSATGSSEVSGFGELLGVAVDSNGDIYGGDCSGEVDVFDPSGAKLTSFSAAPCVGNLAVDPSGAVYVDHWQGEVEKFTPSEFPVTVATTWASAGVVDSNRSISVAVDPATEDLYVGEAEAVAQYDSSGALLSTFGPPALSAVRGLAVDGASGRSYVSDANSHQVAVFGPGVLLADVTTGAASNVVDTSATLSGHLDPAGGPDVSDCHFDYGTDASYGQTAPCAQLTPLSAPADVSADLTGLQPNATYHFRLVADNGNGAAAGEDATFQTLGPPTIAGTNETPNATTKTSATVEANINPHGSDTSYHVDYGLTTAYGSSAPVPDADAGDDIGAQHILVDLAGLDAATTYHFRFVAQNPHGTTTGPDTTFVTKPAFELQAAYVSDVSTTRAKINARINPAGDDTTYHFEYGETAAYGATAPLPDGDLGSGTEPVTVSLQLSGLEPGAAYHYRIVGTNALGTIASADRTFTTVALATPPETDSCPNAQFRTGASAGLPDCRAYELVSPPDKHGGAVDPDSSRTRASSGLSPDEPMAVQFTSLTPFADARGGGVGIDYVAKRLSEPGTQGWATHAITPPQDPMPLRSAANVDSVYEGEFSADLSKGVFRAFSPVTAEDPMVSKVSNLYLRTDLLDAGAGAYELLTGCPGCTTPLTVSFFAASDSNNQKPRFAGASTDFGHVLFESRYSLTADAPPCSSNPATSCPHLYEWDHGTVRAAAILPDGSVPLESSAGQGIQHFGAYAPHVISDDGRRVFFTDNTTGSPSGSGVPSDGTLYMRLDHTSTVQLNASERTDCADHDPCTGAPEPEPPGLATYQDASSDGSRVFFTTNEQLTDAHIDGSALYMYDTTKPASDPHNLTLVSVDKEPADGDGAIVEGLLGASDDGHWVYFLSSQQLVPGAPTTLRGHLPDGSQVAGGIFLWHDGTIRYLGRVSGPPGSQVEPGGTLLERILGKTYPKLVRVSPDGRHLAVALQADPTLGGGGYDHSLCEGETKGNFVEACLEVYVYDAETQTFRCASCNPTGAAATSDARLVVGERQRDGVGSAHGTLYLNHPMTDDGGRVFFSSADPLVPADVNGVSDVYEYEASTGKARLLTTGLDPNPSYFMDASPDGKDVFIRTTQRLVGWDVDNSNDLYDVRVDGGFPEPAAAAVTCGGDSCQGEPALPPMPPESLSDSLRVAGASRSPLRPRLSTKGVTAAQRRLLAQTGTLRLQVSVNRPGTAVARVSGKVGKQLRTVAHASKRAPKATTLSLLLQLSAAARQELSRRGSLELTLTTTFSGIRKRQTLHLTAEPARNNNHARRATAPINSNPKGR